eukprot:190000_1
MFVISWILFFVLMIGVYESYSLPPIPPITRDLDTEYYFANISNEFESGYIECAADKPNCHIQCHATTSCRNLHINASLTQNLLLECGESFACQSIMVYGPNVSASVECRTIRSCYDALFELDDTQSVNVKCDGSSSSRFTQSYACQLAEINAARAEVLDIQCLARSSCRDTTVNGTFVSNSINVLCNRYYGCEDANIYGLFANEVNVFCNNTQPNGFRSCIGLTVYCPSQREHQCNFDCGSADVDTDLCSQIDIYNADNYTAGFLNVSMDTCSLSPPFRAGYACSEFTTHCLSSGLSTEYYHTPNSSYSDHCTNYGCCPITDYK